MNENKDDRNKFKNYWRIILKSRFDLNAGTWKKFRCFKNLMTETDVIDYLLSKDKFFENSYNLYQDILYHLQHTCKLIKRISFGFKNFRNMKSRIMIITNIFRKDKR